jgi:hypothetical protein
MTNLLVKSNFIYLRIKLAQLTNKCQNEDLDYYLKEVGDILGISDKVQNKNNAKSFVKYVMDHLVNIFNSDKLQNVKLILTYIKPYLYMLKLLFFI